MQRRAAITTKQHSRRHTTKRLTNDSIAKWIKHASTKETAWENPSKREFAPSEATKEAMHKKTKLIKQGKPEDDVKAARRTAAKLDRKHKKIPRTSG